MDNLHFIKVYFRIFIYKIIVPKKTWIIQERDKILEYGLEICLSARPGSRKPKKWVQNAPEHKSVVSTQDYHLALLECWIALFWDLAQFSSGADKAHPFRLFHKKTRLDSHSTFYALRAHSFTLKERHPFTLSNFSLPFSSILS